MNILVVDDKQDISNLVLTILEMENHIVTVADSGNEAIKTAENNSYDIIILDIMMDGLDGFETLAKLKQYTQLSKTSFVALTAKATSADEADTLTRGFDFYLSKPFRSQNILELIKKIQKTSE